MSTTSKNWFTVEGDPSSKELELHLKWAQVSEFMRRLAAMPKFLSSLPSLHDTTPMSKALEIIAQRNEWLRDIARTMAGDLSDLGAGHVRGPCLAYALGALGSRLGEERVRMGVIAALTVGRNLLNSRDSYDGSAWSVGHPLAMMAVAFADNCEVDPVDLIRLQASGKRMEGAAWW